MEQQMQKYKARSAVLISVAVMLYILCVIPPIISVQAALQSRA